jgi:eukaryotic-like serine/threonine-protein kinase
VAIPAAPAGSSVPTPPPPPVFEARRPAETDIQRAEDLVAEGRIQPACALGEALARREPGLPAAHRFLGRCYTRAGSVEQARASYRRYLELAPDAADAPFVRAIVDRRR